MGTFGLQTFFSDQNEESTRLHDWIWQSLTFLQKWLKGCVPNMSCNNARLLLLQYGYQIMVRKTNSIEWSWRFTNTNMQWQTATPPKAYILFWRWTPQEKKHDWTLKPLPFPAVFWFNRKNVLLRFLHKNSTQICTFNDPKRGSCGSWKNLQVSLHSMKNWFVTKVNINIYKI